MRTPIGERALHVGDLVCFPAGAAGAHTVRGPGRVMLISASHAPSISVYPDSGNSIVNALTVAVEGDASDPPGYRARSVPLGPLLAEMLGATTLYELDPGESICPYHYEYGNEEWLLVPPGKLFRDADAVDYWDGEALGPS